MTRVKEFQGYMGECALYDCTETFTHRVDLEDRILRGDPENNFWGEFAEGRFESSWFGAAPHGWDDSLAVEDHHVRGPFEMEIDVS